MPSRMDRSSALEAEAGRLQITRLTVDQPEQQPVFRVPPMPDKLLESLAGWSGVTQPERRVADNEQSIDSSQR